jgi:hypothetical protein
MSAYVYLNPNLNSTFISHISNFPKYGHYKPAYNTNGYAERLLAPLIRANGGDKMCQKHIFFHLCDTVEVQYIKQVVS